MTNLLDLPPEIRNEIWVHLLVQTPAIDPCYRYKTFIHFWSDRATMPENPPRFICQINASACPWLSTRFLGMDSFKLMSELLVVTETCRRIREEALPVFFANNTFTFSTLAALRWFMTHMPLNMLASVSAIETYVKMFGNTIAQRDEQYSYPEIGLCLDMINRAPNLREFYVSYSADCRQEEVDIRRRIEAFMPQNLQPRLTIVVEQTSCVHCGSLGSYDWKHREWWIWRCGEKAAGTSWEGVKRKGDAEIGAIGKQWRGRSH